jgi:hypothetical protein
MEQEQFNHETNFKSDDFYNRRVSATKRKESQNLNFNSSSFANRPYQDFVGQFERYYMSYQTDMEKLF